MMGEKLSYISCKEYRLVQVWGVVWKGQGW